MSFWVYMLRCADESFYIGHTDNLDSRMQQHSGGGGSYTANRLPVNLVYSLECETRIQALEHERQIKGWSRAKKQALIDGDWKLIAALARNRQGPSTGSGRTAEGSTMINGSSVTGGPPHALEDSPCD
jgi:putative endonuclease